MNLSESLVHQLDKGFMLKTSVEIVVPSGNKNGSPIILDLKEILNIESRIQEIAFFTTKKAPELLSAFNKAYVLLHEQIVLLTREKNFAERESNKIRSIIILDKVPTILKEKGLVSGKSPMGSEDVRRAILECDDEYTDSLDRVKELDCIIELLNGKLRSIAMAYSSVKNLVQKVNSFNDPRLNAGHSDNESYEEILDRTSWGK